MDSDHAYIHQEWHRAASTRDTPALIALYAKRTRFFVGGYPKSGTTWLQLLLNAHPEVSCIGEGHLPHHLEPLLRQALAQHNALIAEKNATVLAEWRASRSSLTDRSTTW